MHSQPRRRVTACLTLATVGGLALCSGCSTSGHSSSSDWRTAPAPQVRAGVGDSLGNALFLRQIQLAKSVQFQTSPTYAAEMTE